MNPLTYEEYKQLEELALRIPLNHLPAFYMSIYRMKLALDPVNLTDTPESEIDIAEPPVKAVKTRHQPPKKPRQDPESYNPRYKTMRYDPNPVLSLLEINN